MPIVTDFVSSGSTREKLGELCKDLRMCLIYLSAKCTFTTSLTIEELGLLFAFEAPLGGLKCFYKAFSLTIQLITDGEDTTFGEHIREG